MNASTPRVMDLPVARHGDHDRRGDRDALCIEAPLEILINGAPFSVTMRSPGDELELARGLLFTEGVLPSSAPYPYTSEACHRGPWPRKLDLSVPEEALHLDGHERRLVSASSCGLCGKTSLGSLEDAVPDVGDLRRETRALAPDRVLAMQREMRAQQLSFDRSGGTHAAAAFDAQGQTLAFAEDIGRHNAVDKVAGSVARAGGDLRGALIVSTGRLSLEIAAKAVRLGAWGVASRSAATAGAVELAARYGMVMAGFARGRRMNIYCGGERLAK